MSPPISEGCGAIVDLHRSDRGLLSTPDLEAELARVLEDRHRLSHTDMATAQERAGVHIRDECPVREGVGGA